MASPRYLPMHPIELILGMRPASTLPEGVPAGRVESRIHRSLIRLSRRGPLLLADARLACVSLIDGSSLCERLQRRLLVGGTCELTLGFQPVDGVVHVAHKVLGIHWLETEGKLDRKNTYELQSPDHLVCRLLLEKKKQIASV